MSKSAAVRAHPAAEWRLPLDLQSYDRRLTLTDAEKHALVEFAHLPSSAKTLAPQRPCTHSLADLLRPLLDVYALCHRSVETRGRFLRLLCREMARTDCPFWAWTAHEWAAALATCQRTEELRGIRSVMRTAAYLFCGILIWDEQFAPTVFARAIFGDEAVAATCDRVSGLVFGSEGEGYAASYHPRVRFFSVVALVMLVNRTPYLEDFSVGSLAAAKKLIPTGRQGRKPALHRLARALIRLGIIDEGHCTGLFDERTRPLWWVYAEPDVDPLWLAWVQAYVTQTQTGVLRARQTAFYNLLVAGRWLKAYHPAVTSPEQWDEALAHEYVTWTCAATCGELVSPTTPATKVINNSLPLRVGTIDHRLSVMRRFFTALRKMPHRVGDAPARRVETTWLPAEAFATPPNIRKRIQPSPRDLNHDWWAKLTWAAATLSQSDLFAAYAFRKGRPGVRATGHQQYPLAYYRAAGLLWVTAARRSDEIRRLHRDCVRKEWVPEMRDEHGQALEPEEDLYYLRVPTNKLQGEFYVPIPRYTADAIEAWKRLRPKHQDRAVDRRDEKPTEYLFMIRNQPMGKPFLNHSLIPVLCAVAGLVDEAGVPLQDAVGKITSHRARATLATWLRSQGLSLAYIAKLLGHTDLSSLPWYMREDRHRFAREVRKHNPLDRMVTAVLDTTALKTGDPAVFYYLGDGPDGRPHMCASPDYRTCVHQMQCTQCEMHVDAEQAAIIARRPGVLTIEVHIPTMPQVADLLDSEEELGVEVVRHLPSPEVPSSAYHMNKNVPSRHRNPELTELKEELATLTAEWAAKEARFDLRNAAMKSLKTRIIAVAAKIEAWEREGRSAADATTEPTLAPDAGAGRDDHVACRRWEPAPG